MIYTTARKNQTGNHYFGIKIENILDCRKLLEDF